MSSRDTRPKKKSRHKIELEPISMDEILAGPGMSGFVAILDPREEVPHLQALVNDIKDLPLPLVSQERLSSRESVAVEEPPEEIPTTLSTPDTQRDPGAKRDTGSPLPLSFPLPAAEPVTSSRQFHVRRAILAQDGHSSGEEILYQALWNSKYARQESKETRLVTIGWKAMSKMARMTPRNTKRNCQSLVQKLAMEQLSEENSRESIGRTYRLFSYKSILERRRAAGLEWVTRSRGVVFVSPPAAAPPEPAWVMAKRVPVIGFSERELQSTPEPQRDPGVKRDTGVELVIKALCEALPDADDNSASALVEACRQKAPDATGEEIAYFVRLKADLMHRMGTIKSPMGFLKTAVPRCFEGESFRQFRENEARRRDAVAQRVAAQEEDLQRFREEQRAILEDPQSSEQDRQFARQYLGLS